MKTFSTIQSPSPRLTCSSLSLLPPPISTNGRSFAPTWIAVISLDMLRPPRSPSSGPRAGSSSGVEPDHVEIGQNREDREQERQARAGQSLRRGRGEHDPDEGRGDGGGHVRNPPRRR